MVTIDVAYLRSKREELQTTYTDLVGKLQALEGAIQAIMLLEEDAERKEEADACEQAQEAISRNVP